MHRNQTSEEPTRVLFIVLKCNHNADAVSQRILEKKLMHYKHILKLGFVGSIWAKLHNDL